MQAMNRVQVASPAAPRDFLAAAVWAALLASLYVCVYSGCLWINSHREVPQSMVFGWEWSIPFVAWMIVPYASLHLLLLAAPLVCTSEQEMATLVRRLVFAVLVAGLCFLAFPLQMRFTRPEVTGFFHLWYELLDYFDRPHNLVPSLHIAEWVILWAVYRRHTRGVSAVIAAAWFALIAVSTLLTWQHHIVDVVAGAVLGVLAVGLFREREDSGASNAGGLTAAAPPPSWGGDAASPSA